MSVCLLPADFDGVGHYRMLFPAKAVTDAGGKVTMPRYGVNVHEDGFKSFLFDIERTGLPDTDTYVLQNANTEDLHELLRGLQAAGRRVVFETDDLHHSLPKWHPARKSDFTWWLTNLRAADRVTVSTPTLAEVYADYHPDITVIENRLDWEMWADVLPNYEIERERVRIGWMGAANIRAGDLALLRGMIGPFLEAHPNVDFVFTGVGDVHDHLGIPADQRLTIPGQPFHLRLLPMMLDFDIGLIPLEPGLFSDSKSDLKGMEYAAMGIPCVASPSRPYRSWVEPGVNGFLAKTPRQWRDALETLLADDGLRRSMGRAARRKAYTRRIQDHAQPWADIWETGMTGKVNDPKKWGVGNPAPTPAVHDKVTVPDPKKQGGVK